MYMQRTTSCRGGEYVRVEKYFSSGGGRKTRAPKTTPTSEAVKAANKRRADDKLILLGINNFNPGDKFITLTYSDSVTFEEGVKLFSKFLQKIKRRYKNFKYIGVTEQPLHGNGKTHHHLLCNNVCPFDEIMKLWGHGRVRDMQEVYSITDGKLLSYIVKGIKRDENGAERDAHKGGCVSKVTHSRNLIKPIVKVKRIPSRSWRNEPRPKKGYRVADVRNYFDCFGFPAQKYVLLRN